MAVGGVLYDGVRPAIPSCVLASDPGATGPAMAVAELNEA